MLATDFTLGFIGQSCSGAFSLSPGNCPIGNDWGVPLVQISIILLKCNCWTTKEPPFTTRRLFENGWR